MEAGANLTALCAGHERRGRKERMEETQKTGLDEARAAFELERQKTLRSFLVDGYIPVMPAKWKRRQILLIEILKRFEMGRPYPEAEVNEVIYGIHADYCTVRRELVELGWMKRENGVYERVADAPEIRV